jgi:hypothetical protein
MHLRLSCHWNTDIKIVGCDRVDFANCIEHCEFCLGPKGDPLEGKSHECNQLMCGAACAAQMGSDCSKTYQELCAGGLEELVNAGGSCGVDCSAAAVGRSAPLLALAIAALAGSRSTTFAVFLLVACALLQGCEETCDGQAPTLPQHVPDFYDLSKRAGCKDEWEMTTGNPCASDVPVMWARKGYNEQADEDFVTESVENERYHCRIWGPQGSNQNLYCHEWSAFEGSCDEEDFGLCTCHEAASNQKYCQSWTCLMKEAEQNTCWKDCCGDDCQPCVVCGTFGSSRFHMNFDVYMDLLAAEGITTLSNLSISESVHELRSKRYGEYRFRNSECFVSRDVVSTHETQCDEWREIETELSYCECKEAGPDEDFCTKWSCEEKDVGLFSILFAKPRSYAGLIEGHEVEEYTCEKSITMANGGHRCNKWKGLIDSYEEVETAVCEMCDDSDGDYGSDCSSWKCNEYELPRIHDEDELSKRVFFSFVHFSWILTIFSPTCLPATFKLRESDPLSCGGKVIYYGAHLLLNAFLSWLCWSIAFLRHETLEGRWRAPTDPFMGLFVPSFFGWACAVVIGLLPCVKYEIPSGAFAIPFLLFAGGGFSVGLIIVGPIVCCAACIGCGVAASFRKQA